MAMVMVMVQRGVIQSKELVDMMIIYCHQEDCLLCPGCVCGGWHDVPASVTDKRGILVIEAFYDGNSVTQFAARDVIVNNRGMSLCIMPTKMVEVSVWRQRDERDTDDNAQACLELLM